MIFQGPDTILLRKTVGRTLQIPLKFNLKDIIAYKGVVKKIQLFSNIWVHYRLKNMFCEKSGEILGKQAIIKH